MRSVSSVTVYGSYKVRDTISELYRTYIGYKTEGIVIIYPEASVNKIYGAAYEIFFSYTDKLN